MKGWAKKMIWFFGSCLYFEIVEYLYFLINGFPFQSNINYLFWVAFIIVVPLFFLGDDKK